MNHNNINFIFRFILYSFDKLFWDSDTGNLANPFLVVTPKESILYFPGGSEACPINWIFI